MKSCSLNKLALFTVRAEVLTPLQQTATFRSVATSLYLTPHRRMDDQPLHTSLTIDKK